MSQSTIQVDMFEVQLGAGVLLQFRTSEGEIVRVLADAGVKASGYQLDHVQKKLPDAVNSFQLGSSRIDLIIGTHYDADHLDGLVPIIEDQTREIGEAWMPPVANDTERHPTDGLLTEHNFLAIQFSREDGDARLRDYLSAKREMCEQLKDIEDMAFSQHEERSHLNESVRSTAAEYAQWEGKDFLRIPRKYFESHVEEVAHRTSESPYIDFPIEPPTAVVKAPRLSVIPSKLSRPLNFAELKKHYELRWRSDDTIAMTEAHTLSYIRKAEATDAIAATSLAAVVQALKKRQIPILCQRIQDGQPRRLIWQSKEKRFVPGELLTGTGPEMVLLGPSEGLIRKHWDRLPIGDYAAYAAFTPLPIKSITPSNQLSYVVRVGFVGQGILISGDAGCVDFKNDKRSTSFYPELLKPLLPLHVIQVAHHGGCNAYFYNALLAAKYPEQTDRSFLLLSHATEDIHRPSAEFGSFIAQSRKDGDDMQVLFTNRPDINKVRDFKTIICPVVGAQGDVGDIRLVFGDSTWKVLKHAVKVT